MATAKASYWPHWIRKQVQDDEVFWFGMTSTEMEWFGISTIPIHLCNWLPFVLSLSKDTSGR